jgi:hypothetical protein
MIAKAWADGLRLIRTVGLVKFLLGYKLYQFLRVRDLTNRDLSVSVFHSVVGIDPMGWWS